MERGDTNEQIKSFSKLAVINNYNVFWHITKDKRYFLNVFCIGEKYAFTIHLVKIFSKIKSSIGTALFAKNAEIRHPRISKKQMYTSKNNN